MRPPVPEGANDLLVRLMRLLGIRPIGFGSVTFQLNEGALAGHREDRQVNYDLARREKAAQNTAHT